MKYLSLLIMVVFISCKNNSPAAANREEEIKEPSKAISDTLKDEGTAKRDTVVKPDSSKYTLVIMFYSIGEGIDFEAVKTYEDSISAFSARIGKNIDYQINPWGREGETDFCMQLIELTDVEKAQFIAQTKMQLKKAKLVNIYENYPCKHRKRAK
jgi:hypothetical protein